MPHHLRCETCTNLECTINKNHTDSEGFRLILDSSQTFAQREQARLRGCASHSDYKSLEKIRDDLGERLQAYFDPASPLYLIPTSPGGQAIRTVFEYLLRRGEFK